MTRGELAHESQTLAACVRDGFRCDIVVIDWAHQRCLGAAKLEVTRLSRDVRHGSEGPTSLRSRVTVRRGRLLETGTVSTTGTEV